MGATLARSAAIGQQAIAISGPAARRGGPGARRCAGGMGTQATHAHLHGIECVERLGLNPLMRALVWLLEWLPAGCTLGVRYRSVYWDVSSAIQPF